MTSRRSSRSTSGRCAVGSPAVPPYARQRGKVARALDIPEHDLWPDIAAPPPRPPAAHASDTVGAFAAASDLDAPDWRALMRDAAERIELLGETLFETLATTGVPELLAAKAIQGCAVRILIFDTHRHIAALLDQPGVEVRRLEIPARYVIHRFDDELLLTLHRVGGDPGHAPLLHVRRAAGDGLFDRLTEYFSDLWEQDSEPVRPGFDLVPEDEQDEDENPVADARVSAPARSKPRPVNPRRRRHDAGPGERRARRTTGSRSRDRVAHEPQQGEPQQGEPQQGEPQQGGPQRDVLKAQTAAPVDACPGRHRVTRVW